MRGQILEGESIFTLIATFSSVMQVFTRVDVSPAPSIEQSAIISKRGRGRGRCRDFEGRGHGSIGSGRGSVGGGQTGCLR